MKKIKENTDSAVITIKNPILQMLEDKAKIIQAIKDGKSISTIKGIKIVSPL